jgi:hypothetical protein
MKIHNVTQGSVEWMLLRAGIPTASEFDALVTPLFKVKTGEGPKTYLYKKLGEWWQGAPLTTFYGTVMEQGNILEDEAVPWYEAMYGEKIDRIGFATNNDGTVGCSPDGMFGLEGGIEIKCPEVPAHIKHLLNGVLPDDYAAQVHGSMYVTGAKWWKFFSYHRGFPPFILKVERDEEIQDSIHEALEQFLERFEDAKEQLIALNGGPPKRGLTPMPPKPTQVFTSETPS